MGSGEPGRSQSWLSAIPSALLRAGGYRLSAIIRSPATLLGLWALYTLATTLIFHVELRYRLPLYPALIPYAALALSYRPSRFYVLRSIWLPLACLLLTLLHRPYPLLVYQLAGKHWALARAEAALARGDAAGAHEAALAALTRDQTSALAHGALARAALLAGDTAAGERELRTAIELLPAHPYAHLLLGDLLRLRGDEEAAIAELAYETASLEDLQGWAWQRFVTPPPAQLDIGGGLDLGLVGGMHSREQGDWRWTKDRARMRLEALPQPGTLFLRLRSGRPPGAPDPALIVRVNGVEAARLAIGPEWQLYSVSLPAEAIAASETLVELTVDTFTPRDYDPASPDGRRLGVMIDRADVIIGSGGAAARTQPYPGCAPLHESSGFLVG